MLGDSQRRNRADAEGLRQPPVVHPAGRDQRAGGALSGATAGLGQEVGGGRSAAAVRRRHGPARDAGGGAAVCGGLHHHRRPRRRAARAAPAAGSARITSRRCTMSPFPCSATKSASGAPIPTLTSSRNSPAICSPGNYEIMRDSAAAHGLLAKNKELAHASGRFQVACYKEEIEANLRTPSFSGIELLDLHDYLGQGGALIGLLDAFWEPKATPPPTNSADFAARRCRWPASASASSRRPTRWTPMWNWRTSALRRWPSAQPEWRIVGRRRRRSWPKASGPPAPFPSAKTFRWATSPPTSPSCPRRAPTSWSSGCAARVSRTIGTSGSTRPRSTTPSPRMC